MAYIIDVANYFLLLNKRQYERISHEDDRDCRFQTQADMITHLKMQKLVYYAQGLHLAYFNKPLFTQDVEAWEHGPVVNELYRAFRGYQKDDLMPLADKINECELQLDDNEKFIIKMTFKYYGRLSANALRNKTHKEPTWLNTYEPNKNNVIDNELMKSFFVGQIKDDLERLYLER